MKIALIILLVLLLAAILIEYRNEMSKFFLKKEKLSNSEIYEKEVLKFFNYSTNIQDRLLLPDISVGFRFTSYQWRYDNYEEQYEDEKWWFTQRRDTIYNRFIQPNEGFQRPKELEELIDDRQLMVDQYDIHLNFIELRWSQIKKMVVI